MPLRNYAALPLLLLTTCLAQTPKPMQPPAPPVAPAALLLETVRAIDVLERGIQQNWQAERYVTEFDKLSDLGTANEHLELARWLVRGKLEALSRPRSIWDERSNLTAEATHILDQCKQQRDSLLAASAPQLKGS